MARNRAALADTAKTPKAHNFLGPRLREGAFIAVSAICLYLLLALITHSPQDPGWSATGSGGDVVNLGGPTGAWLADVFFSLVGYAAYLFPLLLAYRAVIILLERHQDKGFDWLTFGIRSLGLVLVMIAGTALAAMNDTGGSGLPQGAGGILGQAIGGGFTNAFSGVGSRLILLAVFLFGMTIFTDLSWLKLVERLGSWSMRSFSRSRVWLLATIDTSRDRRARERAVEARKMVITEHVEREKKRTPPKIKPPTPRNEKSEREEKEKQRPLFDVPVTGSLPPLELLDPCDKDPEAGYSKEALEGLSKLLELKLADFGISAEVVAVYPGPVVTRFEIQPAAGVKVSRISNLAKDLARSLAVISVRVVEVIPGKSVVGVEIPNEHREIVNFREVLASRAFDQSKSPLTLALGHDISGLPAGGRYHRFRQVGGRERHAAQPAVQGHPGGGADDAGGPEDAGTVGLRRHSPPADPGDHRHERRRQRPALVRGGNGTALQADGRAGRAQPGGLQSAGRRRQPGRQADPRSPVDPGSHLRHDR
jgi:DNA segregation ATPase FtsK/SpoIIIE, S-DNA-T family